MGCVNEWMCECVMNNEYRTRNVECRSEGRKGKEKNGLKKIPPPQGWGLNMWIPAPSKAGSSTSTRSATLRASLGVWVYKKATPPTSDGVNHDPQRIIMTPSRAGG